MSAILAVLNKQGVALAADSAVTIGRNGKAKIFNNTQKIFPLPEPHSVAIMFYNSTDFMGAPWETIIKIYAKQVKMTPFNSLREYQQDFITFMRKRNFFIDEATQSEVLNSFFSTAISQVFNTVRIMNNELFQETTDESIQKFIDMTLAEMQVITEGIIAENAFCDDFIDYSIEDFKLKFQLQLDSVIGKGFEYTGRSLGKDEMDVVVNFVYQLLRSKRLDLDHTGLVFAGFGEDDIYPHIGSVDISFRVQDRLRYSIDQEKTFEITNRNHSSIVPFAQQDVIESFLNGIDESLRTQISDNVTDILWSHKEHIASMIEPFNADLAKQISALEEEPYLKIFTENSIGNIKEMFIEPTLRGISSLSTNDLAEMAESLVHLTYLKRRITFDEESVGGPIDVAIISKGDGFIWIKRK